MEVAEGCGSARNDVGVGDGVGEDKSNGSTGGRDRNHKLKIRLKIRHITLPSHLLEYPLRNATAFPIPNSIPYLLNLGELPINTVFGSKILPTCILSIDCNRSSIVSLNFLQVLFTTTSCNFHAAQPRSFPTNSSAFASTFRYFITLPK
uniref:Uncharacterized protein n=1 Tax=Cucumis melo TaxID=3656 RepID=A0A9I9EEG6_CUCME